MPLRDYNDESLSNEYRYGFGGHEIYSDLTSGNNLLSFNDNGYDPRIGRRWNLDPAISPSLSLYSVFNNDPILNLDPTGNSPLSIFAKAVLKQGIKKAAKEFIEAQVKSRLSAYMSKSWAKQFLKDADDIMETMDSEWWEYAIEVVPVAGDAYGAYSIGKKGVELWKKVETIQKRVEAKVRFMDGLVAKWGDATANLIDEQIMKKGNLRNALVKSGKSMGGDWQAHHIIPVQALKESDVVQAAVSAGFDINSEKNGLALPTVKHNGSHIKYNNMIMGKLEEWSSRQNGKIDPQKAKEYLENILIPETKRSIQNSNTKLN